MTLAIPLAAASQDDAAAQRSQQREEMKEQRRVVIDSKRAMEISTNLFDWIDLGTINADFGISVSRHVTLHAGLKYNPWKFEPKSGPITLVKNQQKSASLGFRYWPWYVFSGLWFGFKGQYCDYSETGVWRQALDEGKAAGAGLSAGYTLMLNKNVNIEFGAGFWGGYLLEHNLYHCPDPSHKSAPRESGSKAFIALNDINISFHFLF